MLAALQVLALMLRTGKPLSELAARAMQRVPQVLESITLPERRPLEAMRRLSTRTEEIVKILGTSGRVLVRWSGTEPKLRIMLEGPDESRIREWAQELADAARADLGYVRSVTVGGGHALRRLAIADVSVVTTVVLASLTRTGVAFGRFGR